MKGLLRRLNASHAFAKVICDRCVISDSESVLVVRDLIEQAGATLRPSAPQPHSPDFSPKEKAFSKPKAMLRKIGKRTVSGFWELPGRLVDVLQLGECANYFSSFGYDPD